MGKASYPLAVNVKVELHWSGTDVFTRCFLPRRKADNQRLQTQAMSQACHLFANKIQSGGMIFVLEKKTVRWKLREAGWRKKTRRAERVYKVASGLMQEPIRVV